jgi:hypothetical protein
LEDEDAEELLAGLERDAEEIIAETDEKKKIEKIIDVE